MKPIFTNIGSKAILLSPSIPVTDNDRTYFHRSFLHYDGHKQDDQKPLGERRYFNISFKKSKSMPCWLKFRFKLCICKVSGKAGALSISVGSSIISLTGKQREPVEGTNFCAASANSLGVDIDNRPDLKTTYFYCSTNPDHRSFPVMSFHIVPFERSVDIKTGKQHKHKSRSKLRSHPITLFYFPGYRKWSIKPPPSNKLPSRISPQSKKLYFTFLMLVHP